MVKRRALACCALLVAVSAARADQDDNLLPIPLPQDKPELTTPEQKEAPKAFATADPTLIPGWGSGDGKSWWIPAAEIVAFDYFLNRFNHYLVDDEVYGSPTSCLSENLDRGWIIDTDPFAINQFAHPYQGSMYQTFARSAGLSFWESVPYTMFGSLLWEYAGEHTRPSINDMVSTGIGGNFLGEPLFRMASLLIESTGGKPRWFHELAATVISPSTGVNRTLFGDKFDGVFPSHDPGVFTRIDVGYILSARQDSNVNRNNDASGPPIAQEFQENEASIDATVAYGLPGKPGYHYERPFDYFSFQFTASTTNVFENIITRGLLYGAPYEAGDNYRGIWGLYGTFDYISPQIFRASTTGLAIGTTGQWWMSRNVALQGTALAGIGYGAGGVIRGEGVGAVAPETGDGQRDYHYGITPQPLLAARLIFGDRLSIDSTIRNYYVSKYGGTDEGTGSENIFRADISMTLRIYNLHGITVRYTDSRRHAKYEGIPETEQSVGAISIVYSLLGQTRFGAVDWRPPEDGGPLK